MNVTADRIADFLHRARRDSLNIVAAEHGRHKTIVMFDGDPQSEWRAGLELIDANISGRITGEQSRAMYASVRRLARKSREQGGE